MYLFFVHSYVASKMEGKVTMRLKKRFSNLWLIVTLNLSSGDVKNCRETTFAKEMNPIRKMRRVG